MDARVKTCYLVKTTVDYWQDDWGNWATGDEACGSPFKTSYRHIFLKHLALWEGMQLLVNDLNQKG